MENITEQEKNILASLVEKEIKAFEEDEDDIKRPTPGLIAAEEKYDKVLKDLLEKIKGQE